MHLYILHEMPTRKCPWTSHWQAVKWRHNLRSLELFAASAERTLHHILILVYRENDLGELHAVLPRSNTVKRPCPVSFFCCIARNRQLPIALTSSLPNALPYFQPTQTRKTNGHCLNICSSGFLYIWRLSLLPITFLPLIYSFVPQRVSWHVSRESFLRHWPF